MQPENDLRPTHSRMKKNVLLYMTMPSIKRKILFSYEKFVGSLKENFFRIFKL